MSNINCPKCNVEFKFISVLKRHLKISSRCKASEEEINSIIDIINTNITNITNTNNINISNNIISCNHCNSVFTKLSSLKYHNINSRCGKIQIAKEIENKDGVTNLTIEQLKLLYPDNFKIMLNNIKNQSPSQLQQQIINNNNNTHNNDNRIINNTINNINNTIIQHINPFGFEDVRTISIPEMKVILSSGENSGLLIIKAIYNKIENKNFYKPNMSRPEIACLNTEFNLTIYKCKEFCDALFDRCIAFLHHMLYLCKNEYSKDAIKNIYDNIEYIETTMRTEIYDKKLQNIIESEFRNNNIDNKDRIKKFIKELKDNTETKEQSKTLINDVLSLNNDSNDEYKKSITEKEINNALGDPKVIIGLNKQELIEEFHFKHFEDTKFYKFWTDRIKNEYIYINKCKTATIGDIKGIATRKTKIELMLNIIKARSKCLKGGDLIDLDVEGFIYEKLDDDNDTLTAEEEAELKYIRDLQISG